MRKKAFTLIELLVVIAIIAVLLSVLVPALRKAKSQARAVIDQSNLRSLGQAADLYLTQNKEKFFNYANTGTDPLWIAKIGNMVDNIDKIRFCPQTIAKIPEVQLSYTSNPGNKWGTSPNPWLWAASADPAKPYEMGSYGLNGWLYAVCSLIVATDQDKQYKKRTEVTIPSRTPLFLDANWVDGWPKNDNVLPAVANEDITSPAFGYTKGDRAGGNSSVTSMIGRFVVDRHGPMTTVIFSDSHAETITHAALWTLAWHRGSKPNYNPVIPTPIPGKR